MFRENFQKLIIKLFSCDCWNMDAPTKLMSPLSIFTSGGFVQIDQSPYCTCKQDTQERYLWTAEPKGLGGLLPPPPLLHFSEENFFFYQQEVSYEFFDLIVHYYRSVHVNVNSLTDQLSSLFVC